MLKEHKLDKKELSDVFNIEEIIIKPDACEMMFKEIQITSESMAMPDLKRALTFWKIFPQISFGFQ